MGVTVRAQSQQQWLLVSDDTKLGGKGRVLETYLSKEGLEVPPQIASFFPIYIYIYFKLSEVDCISCYIYIV